MNFKTKIIKIKGKNLESFFQNLVTNDIQLLQNNQALYSAMLTPQGKYLEDFIILKDKDFFLIEVNSQSVDEIIKLISKYDLRQTLSISIAKDINTFCILYNDLPASVMTDLSKYKIIKDNNFFIFSDPRKARYLVRIWVNKKNIKSLPYNINLDSSSKLLNLERIKNSIPDSSIDLEKEKSFILNFNFDKLNAISFNKGCYIGQENTSRQNYRGKIKYLLKTIMLVDGIFPEINTELFSEKQKIGVMKSHEEKYGLALLKVDSAKKDKILALDKINFRFKVI
ncbi:MAG: hypothetical protein CMJ08_02060 [Pelagibacterales bacterium]|nr:hypothetical protein [Pelagibacterales bacterium]